MPRKESTQWRFCLSKFHKQHIHTHDALERHQNFTLRRKDENNP